MIYSSYTIGGELMHAEKGIHKYIDKVRTKTGKWRYIYHNTKNYKTNKKHAELVNKNVAEERKKLWPAEGKTSDKNDDWAPRGTAPDERGISRNGTRGYEKFQKDYTRQIELNKLLDDSVQGKIETILDKMKIKKKKRIVN